MNKKRAICGLIAVMMLTPVYANAGMLGTVKGAQSKDTKILGSTVSGTNYNQLLTEEDLTVEMAIDEAIKYSRDIKNLEENVEILEDTMREVHSYWEVASDYSTNHSLAVQLRQLTINLSSFSDNQEKAKEKIAYNVKNIFYAIDTLEKSLDIYDKQLDLSKRNLVVYETMLNLGKISQVDYNNYKYEYDKLVSDRANVENQINSTFRTLNQLMGKDINQKYNIIVDDVDFVDMGKVDVSYEINKSLETNQTVKSAKDAYYIADYDIKSYVDGPNVSADRKEKEAKRNQAQRTLEDTKTSLKNQMTSLYENIIDSERVYKENESKLNLLNEQLKVKEVQFSLGKITQLELDSHKLSIESLKLTMESSAKNHQLSVEQFKNSDLLM